MQVVASVFFLTLAGSASAQSLSMPGDCPGSIEVTISGVTPGGQVRFLTGGAGEGDDVIGRGSCRGTVTGLAGLNPGPIVTDSDGDGTIVFTPVVPDGVCGTPIQVLDVATCGVSNVAYAGADVGPGDPILVFEETFETGVTPSFQCDVWREFTGAIPDAGITGVRMSGTFDSEGIECTEPGAAQMIADALRTDTDVDVFCDGHQWTNCASRTNELWLDPPSLCSGSNCPDPGYLMRPCQANENWGGVNTRTCSSIPSQTQRLEFF